MQMTRGFRRDWVCLLGRFLIYLKILAAKNRYLPRCYKKQVEFFPECRRGQVQFSGE